MQPVCVNPHQSVPVYGTKLKYYGKMSFLYCRAYPSTTPLEMNHLFEDITRTRFSLPYPHRLNLVQYIHSSLAHPHPHLHPNPNSTPTPSPQIPTTTSILTPTYFYPPRRPANIAIFLPLLTLKTRSVRAGTRIFGHLLGPSRALI